MILLLTEWLRTFGMKIPAVFEYYSTRMMLSCMTSLCLSIFLGPFLIQKLYSMKMGQPIRKEDCPLLGQLHEKKENTPTMGGLLILFSMIVSLFFWMDLTHIFTFILLVTTLFLGFVGGRDDYLKLKYRNSRGMSGKKKLFFQALLSFFVALYFLSVPVQDFVAQKTWLKTPVIKETVASKSIKEEVVFSQLKLKDYASRLYLPFLKEPFVVPSGISFLLIAFLFFFVIAGSSNAVNLTDGLDGLAAGCLTMVAGTLVLFAFVSNHLEIARYLNILYIEGSGEIAIYLSAMVGACLGFLWYNSHPAQVFMGDTGSLALGGIIGVSAVLLRREFLLGIIGGVFVVEALSVILQVLSYRWRNKRRIFLCTPIHHHFEYKGWAETKIVTRFWIVGLLLAMIGVASLKFQ